MTTNAQALDVIMSRFGNRSSPVLRARVLQELNNTIRELERSEVKPWFLEDRATGVLVAEQDYIDLPTDFIQEIEESPFKIKNSENIWTKPVKTSMEKLEDETENADPALPEGYTLFGEKIYLGPMPDIAYSYKLPYYKRTSAIVDSTADITNKWLIEFFNYTTLSTAVLIARNIIQSAEIAGRLSSDLATAANAFWREVEARQHTNRTYLLTDSEE